MKPTQLFLRCYAEKVGDQWQAFCLDLSLAAQADTFAAVKNKLDAMVFEYVFDALAGEDRDYAEQLLTRRAPLRDWLKYYWCSALSGVGALHEEARRLFTSLVPLELRIAPRPVSTFLSIGIGLAIRLTAYYGRQASRSTSESRRARLPELGYGATPRGYS